MSKFTMFFLFILASLTLTACSDYELEDYGACATCPPVQIFDGEICDDLIDNDNDGDVDCADSECAVLPYCHSEICDNGIDDNQDGFIDCSDPECSGIASCIETETVCNDGIDNDEDGAIDCDDPNCVDNVICRFQGETDCEDGQDNDQDGLTDCEDPSCQALPVCQGHSDGETNCADGIDNDFDGDVDCDDSDCATNVACVETSMLTFRPASGYVSGYCRDQDDTSWSSVRSSACAGQILLFTVYDGIEQFPNYISTVCDATTLEAGSATFELNCEPGTDDLTCDPICWAICGPNRYAYGTEISYICVLDGNDSTLLARANVLSNQALVYQEEPEDRLFVEVVDFGSF